MICPHATAARPPACAIAQARRLPPYERGARPALQRPSRRDLLEVPPVQAQDRSQCRSSDLAPHRNESPRARSTARSPRASTGHRPSVRPLREDRLSPPAVARALRRTPGAPPSRHRSRPSSTPPSPINRVDPRASEWTAILRRHRELRHAFGAAGYLLRVVRLRLADRCVERRREAAPREIRHQHAGSAAIFSTQPRDLKAEREIERSDDHQRCAFIPDSEEGCRPCAVERELGEVKPPRHGRGSRVDTPPRDRDREIQRRPHRPERGGRRRPWRLTESFVDGRGLPRGEPTEPRRRSNGQDRKAHTTYVHSSQFPIRAGSSAHGATAFGTKAAGPGRHGLIPAWAGVTEV